MSPEAQTRTITEQMKKFEESRFANPSRAGISMSRFFTTEGIHPFEDVAWEKRDAVITNHVGEVIFEQKDVEVPESWSQLATNVVVSKYFAGPGENLPRESSMKELIGRISTTLGRWAREGNYFRTEMEAEAFEAELTHLTLNQYMAFNSPVWFNMGVEEVPQCSACFINSVEDSMESILDLAKTAEICGITPDASVWG